MRWNRGRGGEKVYNIYSFISNIWQTASIVAYVCVCVCIGPIRDSVCVGLFIFVETECLLSRLQACMFYKHAYRLQVGYACFMPSPGGCAPRLGIKLIAAHIMPRLGIMWAAINVLGLHPWVDACASSIPHVDGACHAHCVGYGCHISTLLCI